MSNFFLPSRDLLRNTPDGARRLEGSVLINAVHGERATHTNTREQRQCRHAQNAHIGSYPLAALCICYKRILKYICIYL